MGILYIEWFVFNPAPVGRSLWIRSCNIRNCSRRATVRLGIDTLIANILVSFVIVLLNALLDLSVQYFV